MPLYVLRLFICRGGDLRTHLKHLTTWFHSQNGGWIRKTSWPRHILLKCLYQTRRVTGHIYVCYGIQFTSVGTTILPLDFGSVLMVWYFEFHFSIYIVTTRCNVTENPDGDVGLWWLTPLSTIFPLYPSGQFYWWRKPEYRRKPLTCHKSLTNFITYIMLYRVHRAWAGFQLRTLVVIGTDCIGSL
jgi:hypothetical protein